MSSASILVLGVVKVVLSCQIMPPNIALNGMITYQIHEVSNNPNGFQILIFTDSTCFSYQNPYTNVNSSYCNSSYIDPTPIETISSQSASIDRTTTLTFTTQPSYVHISCISN